MAVAHHRSRPLARPRKGDARSIFVLAVAGAARSEHRFDHQPDIDGFKRRARQLRVDPACVADVGDEAVEPADILVRDSEQLGALRVGRYAPQPFDRRSHRCDGIFKLVGHISGEMFARVDALAQRLRHVAQRACQRADLVAAARQAGDDHLARAAQPDANGGACQSAQRANDRARQKQRQQDRCDHDHRDDDREAEALGAHRARDVARVERHQHHLGCLQIDDAGGAEQRGAFGGIAESRLRFAAAQCRFGLGPGGERVLGRFGKFGVARRADDPVDAAVHRARRIALPRLQIGIAKRIGRRPMIETVGQLAAIGSIEAQPRFGRAREFADQPRTLVHARHLDVEDGQIGRIVDERLQRGFAVRIDARDKAFGLKRDRQDVDGQDARRQRPARRPDERRLFLFGNRRVSHHRRNDTPHHRASRSRRSPNRPRGTCGAGA